MSLSLNYPAINPSLLLDFANTGVLDPRVTFTRASPATYYDGVTTALAEQNLLTYSQDFTDAGWTVTGTTVTANTTTAPDGTTTAETLTAQATNTRHSIFKVTSLTTVAGQAYTQSIFVKANTHNFVQLFVTNQAADWANFNLSNGTIGTTGGTGSSATITAVGNSWYRITLPYVAIGTTNDFTLNMVSSTSASRAESWLAVGTETVFIWGVQVEQRSTATAYTATTTQPITNYIPVLLTAAANVPRFEHNPVTGESLGLEIEEQRTNLGIRSEEFDNASWTKNGTTVSANATIAPDGTLTADKVIATATTAFHLIQATAVTGSGSHTMSVYAKAGEYTRFAIRESNVTGNGVLFDLSAGTIVSTSGATGTITPVGNGWYRCTATVTWGTAYSLGITLSTSTNIGDLLQSFTGNGYSGVFVWGAQLEAGSFATSYIATVASQVTRSADSASMTGTNFSSWYNIAEGTLYASYQVTSNSQLRRILYLGNSVTSATYTNFISINAVNTTSAIFGEIYTGTEQATVNLGSNLVNATNQVALAVKTNDVYGTQNNAAGASDSSCAIPIVDRMFIGRLLDGTFFNGTIKKIAYYPLRLTNAQLQNLTK